MLVFGLSLFLITKLCRMFFTAMLISVILICCLMDRCQSRGCKKTMIKGKVDYCGYFYFQVIEFVSKLFRMVSFFLSNNICRPQEDCEGTELKPNDRSLRTYLSNGEIDASLKSDSSEVRFHSLGLEA